MRVYSFEENPFHENFVPHSLADTKQVSRAALRSQGFSAGASAPSASSRAQRLAAYLLVPCSEGGSS